MTKNRILPSAGEVGATDIAAVAGAVASGWLSPAGPALERFETELAEATGRRHAVGLSSGTSALHLGLLALGVQQGQEVWTSTLTFVATAMPCFMPVAVRSSLRRPVHVDDGLRARSRRA